MLIPEVETALKEVLRRSIVENTTILEPLDMVLAVMDVEEKLKISVPDELLIFITTVGELNGVIERIIRNEDVRLVNRM